MVAVSEPLTTPRMKFVFDSIVAVPIAPSGMLRNAQMPPELSANAMIAPPCITPAVVHSAGDQASRARTSAAVASSTSSPTTSANGIAGSSAMAAAI